MTLGLYINELLFDHNCVVVPGLGGFITRRVPAQINPVSNKITPPGKKVAFNQALNLNDGILAKHVAVKESMLYEKALEKIQSMMVELRQALFEHRTVHLEKVGTFYMDQDEVMTFHPDFDLNVSKEDFGLVTISAVPVQRTAEEKMKQKIRARVDKPRTLTNQTRRPVVGRRAIITAAASILIGALVITGVNMDWGKQLNLGGLNLGKYLNIEWPWDHHEAVDESARPVLYKIDPAIQQGLNTISNAQVSDSSYQLLARGFGSIGETRKFIDDMKKQGIEAKFSIRENGLTWASIATYTNRAEAEKHLGEVKSVFPDARLLVRNAQ